MGHHYSCILYAAVDGSVEVEKHCNLSGGLASMQRDNGELGSTSWSSTNLIQQVHPKQVRHLAKLMALPNKNR